MAYIFTQNYLYQRLHLLESDNYTAVEIIVGDLEV